MCEKKCLVILLIFFAFYLFNLMNTKVENITDEGAHIIDSFFVYTYMREPSLDIYSRTVDFFSRYPVLHIAFYPPLYSVLTSLSFFFIGVSVEAGRIVAVLFSLALGMAAYLLYRETYGNRNAYMSLLVLGIPILTQWGRLAMIDIPEAFFYVLGLVFLIRYLEKKSPLYFFILACTFGFLTKWWSVLLIFFNLPLLLRKEDLKKRGNILSIALLFMALSFYAFIYLKFGALEIFKQKSNWYLEKYGITAYSLGFVLWKLELIVSLFNESFGIPLSLFIIATIIGGGYSKIEKRLLLNSAFLYCFFFFTLTNDVRFHIPISITLFVMSAGRFFNSSFLDFKKKFAVFLSIISFTTLYYMPLPSEPFGYSQAIRSFIGELGEHETIHVGEAGHMVTFLILREVEPEKINKMAISRDDFVVEKVNISDTDNYLSEKNVRYAIIRKSSINPVEQRIMQISEKIYDNAEVMVYKTRFPEFETKTICLNETKITSGFCFKI